MIYSKYGHREHIEGISGQGRCFPMGTCPAVGVSWASIARIELGRQDPSLGTLERLAEGLGVSVVDLVKEAVGTGRMKMQRKRKGRPSKTKGED